MVEVYDKESCLTSFEPFNASVLELREAMSDEHFYDYLLAYYEYFEIWNSN